MACVARARRLAHAGGDGGRHRRRQARRVAARTELAGGGLRDERAAVGGVLLAQQQVERDVGEVGVAVPGLAVGERQLCALDHGVDQLRRRCRAEVEAFQQGELLQEHRALSPGTGLEDGVAAVVERQRPLERGLPAGHVVAGEKTVLRAHEGAYGLGDEAAVPGVAGARQLLLARPGRSLVEDPPVRRGDAGAAEERARFGRRQEDLRRARPLVPEQVLDLADDPGDRRGHRKPLRGEPDRELEHVGEPPGPEAFEQQQPAAERARDDRREQTRPRYQRQAAVAEGVDRRRPRRRPLTADDDHLVALGVIEDNRHVTARAVQVRLHDL